MTAWPAEFQLNKSAPMDQRHRFYHINGIWIRTECFDYKVVTLWSHTMDSFDCCKTHTHGWLAFVQEEYIIILILSRVRHGLGFITIEYFRVRQAGRHVRKRGHQLIHSMKQILRNRNSSQKNRNKHYTWPLKRSLTVCTWYSLQSTHTAGRGSTII